MRDGFGRTAGVRAPVAQRWVVVAVAAIAVAGCGGGGGSVTASGDETSASGAATTETAETAPSETTARRTTTTVTSAQDLERLVESLEEGLKFGLYSDTLPRPEPECFAQAIDDLPAASRQTVQTVAANVQFWDEVGGAEALPLVQAYVRCGDPDALLNMLVIGTIRAIDFLPCIADAWRGKLTPDAVAESFSFGYGLDDLPPDLVAELTAGAAACWSDRQWWIEEVAIELGRVTDLAPEQANCMATAFVDSLGVERAIRLRVLTLPVFNVPPEDQVRMDLLGRCAIEFTWPSAEFAVEQGQCLTGFGAGREGTTVVDCSGPHNAEVVGKPDLSGALPAWPGLRAVQAQADDACFRASEGLLQGQSVYSSGWDVPTRGAWEQGGRLATCVIRRPRLCYLGGGGRPDPRPGGDGEHRGGRGWPMPVRARAAPG